MQISTLTLIVLAASAGAFHLGKRRALSLAAGQGGPRSLHSMPGFYGAWTALWAAVPALVVLVSWVFLEPLILRALLVSSLPQDIQALDPDRLGLLLNDIRNLAQGNIVSGEMTAVEQSAAEHYKHFTSLSRLSMVVVCLASLHDCHGA